MAAIFDAFDVNPPSAHERSHIAEADEALLHFEAATLLPENDWAATDVDLEFDIHCSEPDADLTAFRRRFDALQSATE